MAITGLVHANINCSDYDRSLRFYEALGFRDPDGTVLELVDNPTGD